MARSDPMAEASLADMRARISPGAAMAVMMPMMATTISSSMRVKPLLPLAFMGASPSSFAGRAERCRHGRIARRVLPHGPPESSSPRRRAVGAPTASNRRDLTHLPGSTMQASVRGPRRRSRGPGNAGPAGGPAATRTPAAKASGPGTPPLRSAGRPSRPPARRSARGAGHGLILRRVIRERTRPGPGNDNRGCPAVPAMPEVTPDRTSSRSSETTETSCPAAPRP